MGWDKKGVTGTKYYYRSIRVGMRVLKVYLGRGQDAEREAKNVQERKAEQQQQANANRQEIERTRDAQQLSDDLFRMAVMLFKATLLTVGFYPHKSTWRRRRNARNQSNAKQ